MPEKFGEFIPPEEIKKASEEGSYLTEARGEIKEEERKWDAEKEIT